MSKDIPQLLRHACEGIELTFVCGPCCGGKTTLTGIATMLLAPFGTLMLDTSSVIGYEKRRKTQLGKVFALCERKVGPAALMPDLETMQAIAKHIRMARRRGFTRILVVGTPRTEQQAEWIVDSEIDYNAIHLRSTPERLKRNLERRKRSDDKWFPERMNIYNTMTVPAFDLLEVGCPSNQYITVDIGSPSDTILSIAGLCLRWDSPSIGEIVKHINSRTHPAVQKIAALT